MLNTSKTTKGNKTLDKGVIPFYTKEAFPSDSNKEEDDDVVATKEKMVSIKLKIDETKGETKMNTLIVAWSRASRIFIPITLNKSWNCCRY